MTALRMVVRGSVQGVGFRWWAVRQAVRLGLSGHVRNLPDGSVEVVAAGDADLIEEMLKLCRRGPSAAVVEEVASAPCPEPREPGFTVLRG